MNHKIQRVSGSYILEIFVEKKVKLIIGSLGLIDFNPGHYYYIGSALNGHLIHRVKRHSNVPSSKKNHWHIDYLLADEASAICRIFLIPSKVREECKLAQEFLSLINYTNEQTMTSPPNKISKFGSSDCGCNSHLFYSENKLLFTH